MSTIASIGGSSPELLQMLQRLAGQNEEDSSGLRVRGSPAQGPPPGGPPPDGGGMITEQAATFAEEAGLDSETIASLQDDLDSAISAALEDADESTDPREVIDAAILSTLGEYGLDGDAFLTELQAARPQGGPGQGQQGGELPSSDIVSQMFSLLNGESSASSTNAMLLDTLA